MKKLQRLIRFPMRINSFSTNIVSYVFLSAAICSAGCGGKYKTPKEPRPVKVTLAQVEEQLAAQPIYTSGTLSAKELLKLSFKVAGIIRNVNKDEGAAVKRGDMLAQLDLSEINAKLQQARIAHQQALADYERAKSLFQDSVATMEQLQLAESQLKVASSDLDIAEFNFEYATIKAPVSGRITKRLAAPNELVAPGTPIFVLASTEDNYVVKAGVTEKDILRLHLGDSAVVEFDAYPGIKFPATVQQLAAAIDNASGTYEVELSVDHSDKKMLTGFTANVVIYPSEKILYQLIPVESLVKASGYDAYVFTLDNEEKKAIRTPVKIGFILNDRIAIESGLKGVSRVVKTGSEYLRDQSLVEVIVTSKPI